MPYQQLSLHERELIDALDMRGHRQAAIARYLGRSPGTVSRELARYRPPRAPSGTGGITCYLPAEAHRQAQRRRAAANAMRAKLTDDSADVLADYVRGGLAAFWSPQQIAARLEVDHPHDPAMRISPEAIYQWVYRQARRGEPWHQQLRGGHPRRKPRLPRRGPQEPRFRDARSIDDRPAEADTRQRKGHWESDTVAGTKRSRAVLATHVERKSRFVLIRKLPDATSASFNRHSIAAFASIPDAYRRTLTADNGGEFARFDRLEKKLKLKVYFAHPYKAWQRGANENTNGLIRQFFPKGTDLSKVRPTEVARVQDLLNNRPRKCLNYRTPAEVFQPPPGVALRN